ncbi:molybdenum cofactor biosynthesis protein MoaE [Terasakiispira papahanaumokuakeensis]|uniref:Molybdopterin synthase catalytic subunit n=1 Tax=Terasakiispira papahanaumokuakeensis TaxID=197479 RepID=A0A1E2VBJ4_9GAMM|nr:molybdopterin synthase catalytic subunit MoaE [Terasakiispira papahanaumokuakeensis]ODC04324.1 molybdenum cofactor biosynthesis protein MoaE [Terasakiispira papahanaumokuakeensis]
MSDELCPDNVCPRYVRVQPAPFSVESEMQRLTQGRSDIGATVTFVGYVRDFNERPDVLALTLEHYPAMTEKALHQIIDEAISRWSLNGISVIHRVGKMTPGDPIVLVLVASAHRQAAFEACNFLMDYLKTRAPFWKKEHTASGDYWVSARDSDTQAADRWHAAGAPS